MLPYWRAYRAIRRVSSWHSGSALAFSLAVLPAVLAVAWTLTPEIALVRFGRRRAECDRIHALVSPSPDSSAVALVAVEQSLDPSKVAVLNEAVSAIGGGPHCLARFS